MLLASSAVRRTRRRWRPSALTVCIALLAIGGLVAGLYPMSAAWLSAYNQSQVVRGYTSDLATVRPSAEQQLAEARRYNEALSAGVVLGRNASVPVGDGSLADASPDYQRMLRANAEGTMARVKIPSIDVDLPIYHGTSDAVLDLGAGHLEGSHLPVGGPGTRSVITAHRGLANATMFSNLDRVQLGDTFTVEVFGEVLTYRVRETRVIAPEQTDTLRAEPGEDLVTLITCTPLGINTHRIIVTGERITPTPERDLLSAGAAPTVPGFPWWLVYGSAGLALVAGYVVWQGAADARAGHRRGSGT
ncbi:class C sortase [Leucobacter massiliensis]|uniref:Class C sortase n=1 Tax=Leucobacter massiliensis TaxID=1686285 RepID=A0A2S9QS42_9MICO|nr:class C sortase [Leucobacter massiliensis]PRI12410.1 class C sortase [Leucobacter massiliensis]